MPHLPPRRTTRLPIRFAALSIVAAFAISGCAGSHSGADHVAGSKKGGGKGAGGPPPKVDVLTVSAQPWRRTVRAQGSLVADEFSIVGAKVPGRIAVADVELGDVVNSGATLARMDQSDLETHVAQAEAALAQACAAVGLKPSDSTDKLNKENSPPVRQEKALLAEARSQYDRAIQLRGQGAVTQAEIDQMRAAVDVADARYASSLNAVEEKLATIAIRRADLNLARQQLVDATVIAPFDGLIQQRHVSPGTYVSVGQPVATLVRIDPVRFRGQVPERYALQLQVGQPVEVRLEGEDQPRTGHVARISPELDLETRSLAFEADLPNPDGKLRAGLFAVGDVVVNPAAPVLAVPKSSITEFAGVERLWKLVDGEATEVPVRTGQVQGNLVEILDGISAGDDIVVQARTARAGRVEIVKRVTLDPPEKLQAAQNDVNQAASTEHDAEEPPDVPVRSE